MTTPDHTSGVDLDVSGAKMIRKTSTSVVDMTVRNVHAAIKANKKQIAKGAIISCQCVYLTGQEVDRVEKQIRANTGVKFYVSAIFDSRGHPALAISTFPLYAEDQLK